MVAIGGVTIARGYLGEGTLERPGGIPRRHSHAERGNEGLGGGVRDRPGEDAEGVGRQRLWLGWGFEGFDRGAGIVWRDRKIGHGQLEENIFQGGPVAVQFVQTEIFPDHSGS